MEGDDSVGGDSTNGTDVNERRGEDDGLSSGLVALFAVVSVLIWALLVVLFLRYQKQRKQLLSVRLLVSAHQGDVQFGTPEPMTKEGAGGFSGGEIDPVTGEMTLYKTGPNAGGEPVVDPETALAPWDPRMPNVWGGQRANPMAFAMGGASPGGIIAGGDDGDDDSLGNLSDFEDADFEAFADSLLDDTNLDEELFGYRRDPDVMPEFRNPPPLSAADSLSDFENDEDLLGDAVDPTFKSAVNSTARAASVVGRPVTAAGVSTARAADLSAAYGGRPMSITSLTSLDLDAEAVVATTSYEDVGQNWQTRPGDASVFVDDDEVVTAF
jgi:hypothetical protein